ncbi:MAG TPA: bifunctional folylpolyglutamate synthase/dihydrofolate synthase [Spirochaeta sp.]|nr:bifunctional folylpolyglutamate synthase/dihydrofolate synthase [Spirochaeta sp.]
MNFKTSEEAFSYIESFTNLEKTPNLTAREYRLDRMFSLLELFDQPQQAFSSIHVAGSKGKGSTSTFIAAALKANGFKTGLYCSPHVESYKERISAAGTFFEDSIYAETASEMFNVIESSRAADNFPGGPPTTFEFLTLLSFLIFKKTDCEWAVFETGLGGRLDATNVILPEASVLTVIELEHTEYLGDTIALVAGEKAGIIKAGVPVFSARQKPDAEQVFRSRATDAGSKLFFPDDLIRSVSPIQVSGSFSQAFRLDYGDGSSFDVSLAAAGDFQIKNASLAVSVLKHLMPASFDPAAGIAETRLPGRMELLHHPQSGIPLLLDGAHTVESARSAVRAFRQRLGEDAVLLFGAVSGKDVEGMAEQLRGFREVVISTPGDFKKSDPDAVFDIFSKLYSAEVPVKLIKSPAEALKAAVNLHLPILVTGSFYMVAEIRSLLK